jgi:hypothetical protein
MSADSNGPRRARPHQKSGPTGPRQGTTERSHERRPSGTNRATAGTGMSDSAAVLDEAARRFVHLDGHELGSDELAEFLEWRKRRPGHAEAFARVMSVWRLSDSLRGDPLERCVQELEKQTANETRTQWITMALGLAALALPFAMRCLMAFAHASDTAQFGSAPMYPTITIALGTPLLGVGIHLLRQSASCLRARRDREDKLLSLRMWRERVRTAVESGDDSAVRSALASWTERSPDS